MTGAQVSDSWAFFQVLQRKGAVQQRRGVDIFRFFFRKGFLGLDSGGNNPIYKW